MNIDDTNLCNSLNEYINSDALPMHMPGHKRNPDFIDASFSKDITEINGFDDLHRPEGLIKNINDDAANLWNADEALISVNGSTGLLISTVIALSSLGSILIATNCHISVWHGLELSSGTASTISPSITEHGFMGAVDSNKINEILSQDKSIKSVIITSPTYEGVISDIPSIKAVTDKHDAILIVDEAHGAHLGLNSAFPPSSVADVVIKSIHKTLSAPTQTAVLLFYGDKAPRRLIKHYKDSIESSSPSYVLMDGICKSISIASNKDAFASWVAAINEARKRLSALSNLTLYNSNDPSKFVIITNKISGYELSSMLRDEYSIEVEASFPGYIIAMSGIGDTSASLNRFATSLLTIDARLEELSPLESNPVSYPQATQKIDGKKVAFALTAKLKTAELGDISNHVGETSGEYLFAYPPGIPMLIPGQIITKDVAKAITHAISSGLHLTCEPYDDVNKLFLVDM